MKTITSTWSIMIRITSLAIAAMVASLPATAFAQTVPDLGAAAQFAVLGSSTVTNTGSTVVTGDLGVSPGTEITGFPPGVVEQGQIRANDDIASQAVADTLIAYNDLAGQAVTTELAAAMGMGQVLSPGVYHFTSAADLTGSLVLDAQNDSAAVFVFQVEEGLTVANDAAVSLVNDASAANVFWQIGTSATMGTNSVFYGSILAGAGVTFNTGATLTGRALAGTAVTLDATVVTVTPAVGQVPVDPVDEEEEQTPPSTPIADAVPALVDVLNTSGTSTTALINAGSSSDGGLTYGDSFLTDDEITINGEIIPEAGHRDQAVSVYVVVKYTSLAGEEQWVFKNESGAFLDWNEDLSALEAVFSTASLGESVAGEIFSGTLAAGLYELHLGYSAADGGLIHNDSPMSFTVSNTE